METYALALDGNVYDSTQVLIRLSQTPRNSILVLEAQRPQTACSQGPEYYLEDSFTNAPSILTFITAPLILALFPPKPKLSFIDSHLSNHRHRQCNRPASSNLCHGPARKPILDTTFFCHHC